MPGIIAFIQAGLLCHQHRLAKLRTRADVHAFLADRFHGAALLLFLGRGHCRGCRAGPRHRPPADAEHRQFLGRSDADHALPVHSHLPGVRPDQRLAGDAHELPAVHPGHDAGPVGGRRAGQAHGAADRAGPDGRLRGAQGAGPERTGHHRRRLRPPLRESHAACREFLQLLLVLFRDCRPALLLRPHDQPPLARLEHLADHVRDADRHEPDHLVFRGPAQSADDGAGRESGQLQHGRQGSPHRHLQLGHVGQQRHDHGRGGQQLPARLDDAHGRLHAHVQHAHGRGDLRRHRQRPVYDADLHLRLGVPGRPDDRPHARLPGQEDRALRREVLLAAVADDRAGYGRRSRHGPA